MVDRKFYGEYGQYQTSHNPGVSVVLTRKIGFNPGVADMAPVVEKGIGTLTAERKASVAKEKELYERILKLGDEWVLQAAQTLLIDKAIEYLKVPEIPHTSNVWTVGKDGVHEISNRVYLMKYVIQPNSKVKASGWIASWCVLYNVQEGIRKQLPLYSYTVAAQEKKKYEDESAAKRYVQGRVDAFAHLFTELSPPVPEKEKFLFSFNGHLLPGYTLAPHEPTPDELLAFVDERDIGGAELFKKPHARKETSAPKRGKAR